MIANFRVIGCHCLSCSFKRLHKSLTFPLLYGSYGADGLCHIIELVEIVIILRTVCQGC